MAATTTAEADDDEVSQRTAQRRIAKTFLERAESRLAEFRANQKTHVLLVSVAEGLYQEVDKLNKKAPAEAITDLMCKELNVLISDATKLMKDDPYVARVKPFVAAGENPENRDALLVLRTLLQGLKRCVPAPRDAVDAYKALRRDSGTVVAALDYWLKHKEGPDANDIQNLIGFVDRDWLEESDEHEYLIFSFERLDEMDEDLAGYFESIVSDSDDGDAEGDEEDEEAEVSDEDEDE